MSVTGARVAAIFALFGVTMLAGFGPVFVFNLWKRKQETNTHTSEDQRRGQKFKSAKILHLLLVFGGGVLLATCFVHMIPEIRENYDHYMETHKHSHNESSTFKSEVSSEVGNYDHNDGGDEDEGDQGAPPWVEICICVGIFLTYAVEEVVLLLIGSHSHDHSSTSRNTSRNIENGFDSPTVYQKGDDLIPTSASIVRTNDQDHLLNLKDEGVWTRFLRGLIIVVAFLAHAIFDGVAIGLQTTTYSIWTIFFAICLHKLVVVFAIGFELFEKTASLLLTFIHITLFSIMSPIGIILSIIIEGGLSEDESLTLILLNAVATGAILYIVFLEILQANKNPGINGLLQLTVLVIGFILMTLMTTLISDGE